MKLIKPKFWDREISLIAILLLPLSLVFLFLIFLRKKFFKINIFKIPIVCVGNIYIGGTGKTPTAILLANELSKVGKKAAILRKYYKNHDDEYNLIKRYFDNLIISRDRVHGIKEAENSGNDIVILDDGLQDYSVKKNLKIVCFNQNQLIGNGLVLPSGPLRESLSALIDTDIILINGKKEKNFEEKILKINKRLEFFYSSYKAINANEFRNKRLLALAGIGNPENFLNLIKDNNLIIEKKLIFPDHYKFSRNEIQHIVDNAEKDNLQIIMTEKDYFKIKDFKINNIKYLKIQLVVDNQKKLLSRINSIT